MDFIQVSNNFIIWLCVLPGVFLVLFQAYICYQKAYKCGLEIGMTKEQLRSAIRASAYSSFGPSLVILSGLMALLVLIGGPMAWMRLSYIGAVMFETIAFNLGMTAAGETASTLTSQGFITGLWIMVLGSIPWLIFSALFTDKIDMLQQKVSRANPTYMVIIAAGAMGGALVTLTIPYVFAGGASMVASISGAVIMGTLMTLNVKIKKQWLNEWSLAIALFSGMLIASAYAAM